MMFSIVGYVGDQYKGKRVVLATTDGKPIGYIQETGEAMIPVSFIYSPQETELFGMIMVMEGGWFAISENHMFVVYSLFVGMVKTMIRNSDHKKACEEAGIDHDKQVARLKKDMEWATKLNEVVKSNIAKITMKEVNSELSKILNEPGSVS